MCHHPLLWGLVAGFLVSRLLLRMRRFRHGCGGSHRGRFSRWHRGEHAVSRAGGVTARIAQLVIDLELNGRQREAVEEVFGMIHETLGARFDEWADLDLALSAIAGDSFDRARAEAAFAHVADPARKKELVDGVEHIHNILTPEQRARLAISR